MNSTAIAFRSGSHISLRVREWDTQFRDSATADLTPARAREIGKALLRFAEEADVEERRGQEARIAELREEADRIEAGLVSLLDRIVEAALDRSRDPVFVIGAEGSDREEAVGRVMTAAAARGSTLALYPSIYRARRVARQALDDPRIDCVAFASHRTEWASWTARLVAIVDAGKHRLAAGDEYDLFDLAEKRTDMYSDGKIVAFFDVDDAHIAEASRQWDRARVFRLPLVRPGN